MAIEISDMDGKIGGLIIRLACGLLGMVGIVMLTDGLISWVKDNSVYASIWNAMVGDEPYCRFPFGRTVLMGGGLLWRQTPNGMLPALCEICLSFFALAAALFHRFWLYCIVAVLIFLRSW
jgi:hypothetical protein